MQQAEISPVRVEGGVLAELYAVHSADVLRLAYLLTGDSSQAEDLVQDAFVRLAGRLVHLRDPAGFHAYLRITLVNLARSQFRRRRLERRYAQRQQPPTPVPEPDVSERAQMRVALLALPVRQRMAVVLRFYEDLSEAQTAELMHCGTGAVNSLVSRAMASLRTTIGED